MKRNIGKTDRIIRMIIGTTIIILGAQFNSILGVFGIIPIITSQVGVCPVYLPFGINTIFAKTVKKVK